MNCCGSARFIPGSASSTRRRAATSWPSLRGTRSWRLSPCMGMRKWMRRLPMSWMSWLRKAGRSLSFCRGKAILSWRWSQAMKRSRCLACCCRWAPRKWKRPLSTRRHRGLPHGPMPMSWAGSIWSRLSRMRWAPWPMKTVRRRMRRGW